MKDQEIKKQAEDFAKKNRKTIAKEFTDINIFQPLENPISVFMAGSPGAGKTEFSKNLVSVIQKNKNYQVIRIDGNEIREKLPGYTGKNSFLFQKSISLIIEKIHDKVLSNGQNFILDGTCSKPKKAIQNIERSLKRNRSVFIFYVHQKPEIA